MRLNALVATGCALLPFTAIAGKLTTVATFPAYNDGAEPSQALTAIGGAVYGVTTSGGAGQAGTIFQLDPGSGRETVLYTFHGGADGSTPASPLAAVGDKLYGTTSTGGTSNQGTVFSFDPATGTEALLYSFPSTIYNYGGPLTRFGNLLYGTVPYGPQAPGYVYSIDPSTGAEAIVHSFGTGAEGGDPTGGVIAYNGALYGLTGSGGAQNAGALYRLDPASGQVAALYSFATGQGPNYEAGMIVSGGVLYGTTPTGGANGDGAVFAFDPRSLKFSIVHAFNGPDGNQPAAGLLAANGLLYGTTSQGGSNPNYAYGTVFSVDPANGAEVVLHSFSYTDGFDPTAALIEVGGVLLGTAAGGGAGDANDGVAFSLDPTSGQEATLHNFSGSENSANSALVSFQGALYGTTDRGGAAALGTIFKVDPQTGVEQTVYAFTGGPDGLDPTTSLVSAGGKLFGTTKEGGTNDDGTVFRFDPATGTETVLLNFGSASVGVWPSVLTNVSGVLYGTTSDLGPSGFGALFAFDPASNNIASLHPFSILDGGGADSGVIDVNGILYGAADFAGPKQNGTIFSFALASGKFTTVHTFQGGADGAAPLAGLVYADGALFGATSSRRNKDMPTLYRIDAATGAETVVYTLPKSQGLRSAMIAAGGVLYGTIPYGPTPNGNLFRFDPTTQQFTTIYKFKGGTDGGNPYSSLLSVGNYLYGTTHSIMTANGGTVFRIHH